MILPFEQDFYKQYGYEVDFVGHPLMDTVKPQKDEATFRRELAVDDKAPLVGLLPGSRRKEIATLLPIFLQAAKRLAEQNPNLTFLLPKAPTINRELLDAHGLAQAQKELDIRLITEDRYTMMSRLPSDNGRLGDGAP